MFKVIKKFNKTKTTENLPKPGRPRALTACQERKIVMESKMNPFLTANEILQNTEYSVSVDTIKRRLRENNLHGRISMRKPFLTKRNAKQRYKFAVKHFKWTKSEWEKVIFSDECKIDLNSKSRKYVRRPRTETFTKIYPRNYEILSSHISLGCCKIRWNENIAYVQREYRFQRIPRNTRHWHSKNIF